MRLERSARLSAFIACAALGLTACGDDDETIILADAGGLDGGNVLLDGSSNVSPDGSGPIAPVDSGTPLLGVDSGTPATPPVYVWSMAIPNADGDLDSYVGLTNSPDFASIDRSKLRMFQPYSGVAAIENHVFIGDANGPFVTKFRITDSLQWEEVAKINFGAYPLPEGEMLNFYFANFKSETTVYHHYGDDKSWRIVWNPREAKIVTSKTDTNLPEPTSTTAVGASGNRTDIKWFKGPVVQPFHQTILATDDYGPESYLAVYDPVTHDEKTVITVPNCPGLEQVTMDEQGNLYVGTTYNIPLKKLANKGPAPCVVRLKSDATLDTSFPANDMSAWTGGHYGINFRYLRDGKATAHIFHEERVTGFDFNNLTPEQVESLSDGKYWELELIDLVAGTSKVITGWKEGDDVADYGRQISVDGKTYYVHQSSYQSNSTSHYYELNTDGTVTFRGETVGEIWTVTRLR